MNRNVFNGCYSSMRATKPVSCAANNKPLLSPYWSPIAASADREIVCAPARFAGGSMPSGFVTPTPRTVQNRLLRALPITELEQLWPRLERVELFVRHAVLLPDAPVQCVYFVETGTVSMFTTLEDGVRIEVGLVGPEGMVGLPVLLGAETSAVEGMVQVDGVALRLSAAAFQSALKALPTLLRLLLRYVDAFHSQVTQSAACNGRHQIEQRLARWLLMTHDRVEGDSFQMTQEFMSTMLGVRRPGVTLAMSALQRGAGAARKRPRAHSQPRRSGGRSLRVLRGHAAPLRLADRTPKTLNSDRGVR
jgi:CRP-like cAMP-binding protein